MARRISIGLAGEGVTVSVRIDGFSRLAYTEALPDEQARTAIGFTHRARAFFARHGITHIHRILTDNGACYRARDFATVLRGARHQRITPYTPRHNGKVERCGSGTCTTATIDPTPPPEPATRLHTAVTNVLASYS
jgi:transposase InsO family protein